MAGEEELSIEYEQLLRESATKNEAREQLARACAFLAKRGIEVYYDFMPEDQRPVVPFIGETEEEQLQSALAHNDDLMANIAMTTITVIRMALIKKEREAEPDKADPDAKKRLQAYVLANGMPKAFFDLVDAELEGDPLQAEDTEIYAEALQTADQKRIQDSVNSAESELEIHNTSNKIYELLVSHGLEKDHKFSIEEEAVRSQLVILYLGDKTMKKFIPSIKNTSKIEEARILLGKFNISASLWYRTIEDLFGSNTD